MTWLSPRAWLIAALAIGAFALSSPAARAGQIVWTKGTDLWVMNDDGSGAHRLVAASQIPGATNVSQPSLAKDGTNLAFVGSTPALANGQCGLGCIGLYTLLNGVATRISSGVAPCGAGGPGFNCESFDSEPTVTTDGRVVDQFEVVGTDVGCIALDCTATGSGDDQLQVRPLNGAGSPQEWQRASTGAFDPDPAADPANPSLIAYVGNLTCNPDCFSPVIVGDASGSSLYSTVYGDDEPEQSLDWNPEGTKLVDVEGGSNRGIWVFSPDGASNDFTQVLVDPVQSSSNPDTTTFTSARFLGDSKILFSADGDLWTVPASCNQCRFPQDATRLTSDGSSTSQNIEPTWTASTAPILPAGAASPSPPPAPPSGPKPPAPSSVLATIGSAHLVGAASSKKGLVLTLVLSRAGSISVRIDRLAAHGASGSKARRRPRYTTLGSVTFRGHAGKNTLRIKKVRRRRLRRGSYRARITVKDAAGASKPRTLTFRVRR